MQAIRNLPTKPIIIFLATLFFCIINPSRVFLQAKPFETVFFVATNGNDQWSGKLPHHNFEKTDGPFASIRRARDTIRELKKKGVSGPFVVIVRGGTYELRETLTFTQEDSGTEKYPIIYKAFPNENPILSGSRKIENFVPYKGNICKATLSGMKLQEPARQLFDNGKRQILARYPNVNTHDFIGGGFLYVTNIVTEGNSHQFKFHGGEIPQWTQSDGIEIFIFPGKNWTNNILPVLNIDYRNNIVNLAKGASHPIVPGNRFYFQNILEELDSPGEWYFERKEQTLYLWPINEESLQNITVPVLKSIIEIKTNKFFDKHNVAPGNIRFEGFTMKECAESAMIINGAENIIIARSTIFNVGKHGVEIINGSNNAVIGNDIYDIGGTGISISAGDHKKLIAANNRAENNYIHNTGVFEKGGASGILCRGVGNIVSHNLIHSTPRVGIWIDGNDHLVEFNHIHNVNRETSDSGAIYFGQIDWTKRGNIVQYNYIHHSGGYGLDSTTKMWRTPFDTYGIYLDDWASGARVYGNIITDTPTGGIFIHSGRDNIIENNIIVEGGRLGQMVYSGWPVASPTAQQWLPKMFSKIKEMGYTKYPELSSITDMYTGAKMSGNRFIRNIIYYINDNYPLYGIYNHIDLETTISDYNVIYHAGKRLLIPYMKVPPNLQWQKWQEIGFDKNSIIADPMIVDIAKRNFRLLPDSPALKLGFKPIPVEKMGLYKDPLRASWPIEEFPK